MATQLEDYRALYKVTCEQRNKFSINKKYEVYVVANNEHEASALAERVEDYYDFTSKVELIAEDRKAPNVNRLVINTPTEG